MPIKTGEKFIRNDHSFAIPVGTITEASIDSGEVNKITCNAVLWEDEYPEEVSSIEEAASEDTGAQISWEIAYSDSESDGETDWLKEPYLLAATFVRNPAYQGRTPLISIASENTDENTSSNIDTVSQDGIHMTDEELNQLQEELSVLRAFKESVEKEQAAKIRQAKVLEVLGEIPQEHVSVLAELTDTQLDSVKVLLSSKKNASSNREDSSTKKIPLPEPPVVSDNEKPGDVLRASLRKKNLGDSHGNQ